MAVYDNDTARGLLRVVFDAAVASAAPGSALLHNLPPRPRGRCVVVGAGKAAAAMAAAIDAAWSDVPLDGVVVTRDGHAIDAGRITVLEAAHPVPDERSLSASRKILEAVQGLGCDDLVIAMISGGASALLSLPAAELDLADKQAVHRALLSSGASIREMNVVRKALSSIKGGRLAQAVGPARIVTLLVSDVPGDDPLDIGSAPTIGDPGTLREAAEIVARHHIALPETARAVLAGADGTAPPPRDRDEHRIIVAPSIALRAAADAARAVGVPALILGDAIEGEAREVARVIAGIALSVQRHGLPAKAPMLLLSGGETTVTIGADGAGRGGRNMEFSLALALALDGRPGIWALAADSDGIDGTEDAAGAFVIPETLARITATGHDARNALQRHDSYSVFSATGDLLITGPTMTNVNDIRAVLVT